MATDRFMIAPINSGLQNDVRPWLIPDDAFMILNNAYVFRGRVRKRFGEKLLNGSVDSSVAQLYSRLRINIGNTPGPLTLPGGITQLAEGQMFSVGDDMFTVWQLGAGVTTLSTNGAITATIDNTVSPNTVTFTGAVAGTAVYYYPAKPVMGFITYETGNINDESVYAFDTQFAYEYNSGAWTRLGTAIWTGSNSQFFWGSNWRGAENYQTYLFVTNNNATDGIKFWDGAAWNNLTITINSAGDTVSTARLMVPFKDRLVLFNTTENITGTDRSFVNRCRFSQNGDPITTSSPNAWREDISGRGGYIDAPTKEQIITCEFLKDRLIVYFERSTWELAYTGNQVLPFVWQQINTELGAESTFSIVPFDKFALGVGNVGIHACNGSNVERIDQKIPDEVFIISNSNEGVFRVYGIRDYYVEMVYWTFPSSESAGIFPDRVLVYNYKNGSWAFNHDSITAFGYFQNQNSATWDSSQETWEETEAAWQSGPLLDQFRQIIAGNQEGFTFLCDPDIEGRNAPSLQITNITQSGANEITFTCINHNLRAGGYADFIIVENAQGVTGLNNTVFKVQTSPTTSTFTIYGTFTGTYTGGGTIARVSRIDIYTKQYNFYVQQGRNAAVNKVDFLVDKTSDGAITVDYLASSSDISLLDGGATTGSSVGTGTLSTAPYSSTYAPLELWQTRLWHPIYPMVNGEAVQLRIYLNDEQLQDTSIAWSDFQMHAMTFYTNPTGSRLQ